MILAICSKNNYDDAIKVFQEHPSQVLKEEHFAAWDGSWAQIADYAMHCYRQGRKPGVSIFEHLIREHILGGSTEFSAGACAPEGEVCGWRTVSAYAGATDLFIYPGYAFRVVDGMITNFHLPRSTLLMLVSAFAGRELMLHAYKEAIRLRYRFFSFGDAMLLV